MGHECKENAATLYIHEGLRLGDEVEDCYFEMLLNLYHQLPENPANKCKENIFLQGNIDTSVYFFQREVQGGRSPPRLG